MCMDFEFWTLKSTPYSPSFFKLENPVVLTKQACGCTPLILAIQSDAPTATLQFMVQQNPAITLWKNKENKYPLRIALEQRSTRADVIRLLCTSPEVVRATDSLGRNCLLLVLEEWSSSLSSVQPEVIETLLGMDNTSEGEQQGGDTWNAAVKLSYRCFLAAQENIERTQRPEAENTLQKWWQVVVWMVKAVAIRKNRKDFLLLHAALATRAPSLVIRRILDSYPSCALYPDKDSNYPLHLVVCQKKNNNSSEEIARMVLGSAPIVASRCDATGRLPLHVVSAHGSFSTQFLSVLVRAYPVAVTTPDPATRLYPFAVAAGSEQQNDSKSLTTSFQLLVAAPELLVR
jgi:hypothetical protein